MIGRKNHYGSKSQRGTEVAALLYSLLESAKLAGVDPAAYLAEATRRAIADPGAARSRTISLPPDALIIHASVASREPYVTTGSGELVRLLC